MEHVFYEGKVMWSQIDANMHLRHSAYADFAAQARLEILEKLGFDAIKWIAVAALESERDSTCAARMKRKFGHITSL